MASSKTRQRRPDLRASLRLAARGCIGHAEARFGRWCAPSLHRTPGCRGADLPRQGGAARQGPGRRSTGAGDCFAAGDLVEFAKRSRPPPYSPDAPGIADQRQAVADSDQTTRRPAGQPSERRLRPARRRSAPWRYRKPVSAVEGDSAPASANSASALIASGTPRGARPAPRRPRRRRRGAARRLRAGTRTWRGAGPVGDRRAALWLPSAPGHDPGDGGGGPQNADSPPSTRVHDSHAQGDGAASIPGARPRPTARRGHDAGRRRPRCTPRTRRRATPPRSARRPRASRPRHSIVSDPPWPALGEASAARSSPIATAPVRLCAGTRRTLRGEHRRPAVPPAADHRCGSGGGRPVKDGQASRTLYEPKAGGRCYRKPIRPDPACVRPSRARADLRRLMTCCRVRPNRSAMAASLSGSPGHNTAKSVAGISSISAMLRMEATPVSGSSAITPRPSPSRRFSSNASR